MGKTTKRSATVAAAVAVAVIGAGVAYATWTNSTVATTSASAGKMEPLTVTAAVPTALLPGTKSDLKVTVNNPNAFPILVKTITVGSVSTSKSGCSASTVSATGDPIPSGLLVPAKNSAGNGSIELTYPSALQMAVSAPNACQEAVYNFNTTVVGELQSASPAASN